MAFLDVIAGNLPEGNECYPQTPQELLDLYAQYLTVEFDETYSLFVTGPGPIAIEDQDKIWFERSADGAPVSINSFDTILGEWISFYPAHGSTAERPASPKDFQMFFDTDINTMLIYERAAWRTAEGSPGDTKFVVAVSAAAAITQNPGWIEYTAMRGRSPIGAGTGAGLTARTSETDYGAETATIAQANLPSTITASVSLEKCSDINGNGTVANGVMMGDTGFAKALTAMPNSTVTFNGMSTPLDIMNPVRALFCLIKE
jgi:hypothetical protein